MNDIKCAFYTSHLKKDIEEDPAIESCGQLKINGEMAVSSIKMINAAGGTLSRLIKHFT